MVQLIKKHKQFILYAVFGVLTTIVNTVSYWLLNHTLHIGTILSTILAWLLAVALAYITNRKLVFNSQAEGAKQILIEILEFFSCRIATGVLDVCIMYMFVDCLGINDLIIKLASNILVIIVNFIASKAIIFKHNK